jgi:hypothetical protein
MHESFPVFANPLADLGFSDAALLEPGAFSAVCARPGVGKTAFLVQMALWAMSHDKNVLHVSLGDPIKKVDLWYQDLFSNLARRFVVPDAAAAWTGFFPRRFIMTFRVEGFSIPKFEERLADLVEQQIFIPQVLILDGIASDAGLHLLLQDLKTLSQKFLLPVWVSVQTQHYPDAVSASLDTSAGAFESIVSIEGAADRIHVRRVKGGSPEAPQTSLCLDPATLLLSAPETS